MLRQDQLQTLKQTHRTATTVMPLVTAGLALMSAMIAAQERRTAHAATSFAERQQPEELDLPRVVRVTTPRTQTLTANPTVNLAAKPATPARERRGSDDRLGHSVSGDAARNIHQGHCRRCGGDSHSGNLRASGKNQPRRSLDRISGERALSDGACRAFSPEEIMRRSAGR